MHKVDIKTINIQPQNIAIAETIETCYMETKRYILLEPNCDLDDFIILYGSHNSSFGFDSIEWEVIGYSEEELTKIANADYNSNHSFWNKVKFYLLDDTTKYNLLFGNKSNL